MHLLLEESDGAIDIFPRLARFACFIRGELIASANRQAQANAQLALLRLLAPLVFCLNRFDTLNLAVDRLRTNLLRATFRGTGRVGRFSIMGYSTASALIAMFQRQGGLTPEQYRRRMLK
mgnify:CR=1 FL=1